MHRNSIDQPVHNKKKINDSCTNALSDDSV